jgi:hypothetical protein
MSEAEICVECLNPFKSVEAFGLGFAIHGERPMPTSRVIKAVLVAGTFQEQQLPRLGNLRPCWLLS